MIVIIDNQSQYSAHEKWGCGHAKAGVVVKNFTHTVFSLPTYKELSTPLYSGQARMFIG